MSDNEPRFDYTKLNTNRGKAFRIEQWEEQHRKEIKLAHEKLNSYCPGASKRHRREKCRKVL